MSFDIKLKWTNTAPGSTTKIYRSDSTIDRQNLPASALVTLTNGENSYVDKDVLYGKEYFYVFESIKGNDRATSRNYRYSALPYSGPGPQSFLYGDAEYGYYGSLTSSEMISIEKLKLDINLSQGTIIEGVLDWHKYSIKGKILFIPNRPLASQVSWRNIYNAGALHGDDTTGAPANTPVVQNAKVKIGQDTFRVRAPSCLGPEAVSGHRAINTIANGVLNHADFVESEFDKLIVPLTGQAFNNFKLERTSILDATLYTSPTYSGGYLLCKEVNPANTVNIGRTLGHTASFGTITGLQPDAGYHWAPVLELVR